jgi:hypothetical protein
MQFLALLIGVALVVKYWWLIVGIVAVTYAGYRDQTPRRRRTGAGFATINTPRLRRAHPASDATITVPLDIGVIKIGRIPQR